MWHEKALTSQLCPSLKGGRRAARCLCMPVRFLCDDSVRARCLHELLSVCGMRKSQLWLPPSIAHSVTYPYQQTCQSAALLLTAVENCFVFAVSHSFFPCFTLPVIFPVEALSPVLCAHSWCQETEAFTFSSDPISFSSSYLINVVPQRNELKNAIIHLNPASGKMFTKWT